MDMCYGGLDLPPIIQRAICRVNDPGILQDLNPNLRWALSVLLRRVSAVNGKDIFWVKRENFAKLLGASQASVYRILGALEDAGLLQRVAQKRSAEGAFSVGELKLSEGLCNLLGLTLEHRDESTLYTRKKMHRLSVVKDGIYNQENTQFSSKKQSETESSENRPMKPKQTIPPDLAVLVDQGLTFPQVFKLMSVASKNGKRLSDIVAVCKSQLQKLSRNDLFAYVRKLTTAEKDFAYVREKSEVQVMKNEAEQKALDEVLALQSKYAGRWFAQGAETAFSCESNGMFSVYRKSGNRWGCVGATAGDATLNIWSRIKNCQIVECPALAPELFLG